MNSNTAFLYALLICIIGAGVTLVTARSKRLTGWLAVLFTTVSGVLAGGAAIQVLLYGPQESVTLLTLFRFGSSLRFYIDGLSAVFVLLVAGISLLASLYSVGYMDHYTEYSVRRYYPYLLLFVAGMYGIVTTSDLMVFFCLFWQLMTLPSYALIRYEWRKRENVSAANRYLFMMEMSCALVMIGAWCLASAAPSRSGLLFDFDILSEQMTVILQSGGLLVTLAFLLFLVGFGIKAGIWPFGQMWLPAAHPAAPSPVSAMLSGVMIKTGVYGLMRSFLWLVPLGSLQHFPAGIWGAVIASLGAATLLVGTLQALRQEQTKRLLAFHSIGQVGYIVLGLGSCLALMSAYPRVETAATLAAIAFCGGLLHTINHATFKSLLFFNAGSILFRSGTQDMNRIGGLAKYMPLTAVTALVASFSIAGVPLFNGFISKWSIYAAAILGSPSAGYLAVFALIAILTSGVTLASFVKFYGITFLGRTSQVVREKAAGRPSLEVPAGMMVPQLVLAVVCLLLGIVPTLGYSLVQAVFGSSQGGLAAALKLEPAAVSGPRVALYGGTAFFAPALLLAGILGLLLVARTISRLGASKRRVDVPWLCGYVTETDATRYRAHGLYADFKRYFHWLGGMPGRPAAKDEPLAPEPLVHKE